MKHIPAILLLISLGSNFIDLSHYFIGNVAGYSLLVCIALLSNPIYGFPQRMYICGLMTMNIVGLVCYFFGVDYDYTYSLVIASVIVAISIIRLNTTISERFTNNN